jgi:hypothetical protein
MPDLDGRAGDGDHLPRRRIDGQHDLPEEVPADEAVRALGEDLAPDRPISGGMVLSLRRDRLLLGRRFGGVRAAMQLRMTLAELGMPTVSSPLPVPVIADAVGARGEALQPWLRPAADRFLDDLLWWAAAARDRRERVGTPFRPGRSMAPARRGPPSGGPSGLPAPRFVPGTGRRSLAVA